MNYDENYSNWKNWNNFGEINELDRKFFNTYVKSNFPDSQQINILEIGFGNGSFLSYGQELGWEMSGTEINPALQEAALKAGYKVYKENEYENLSDNSFDCICAFDVLEHLNKNELNNTFKKVNKLLKPGGIFITRFPNGDSPFGLYNQNGDLTHISFIGTGIISSLCLMANYDSFTLEGEKRFNPKKGTKYFLYHIIVKFVIKFVGLFISFIFPQFKNNKFLSPNLIMVAKKGTIKS